MQEQAKQAQDGGDIMAGLGDMNMESLTKMMDEAMKDPETKKLMDQMGDQFGTALEQLSKMTPEEIEQQMKDAFKMMSDGSMVDDIVGKREEILQQLEEGGTVPAEELAKFRADPEYFELRMRESFDQMKNMMGDPDMLKTMTDAMGGMKDLMDSGGTLMTELNDLLTGGELQDDDKIEEARLKLLKGDFSDNPFLKEMMNNAEMQELLRDKDKWAKNVKEGMAGLGGAATGARVGEL